MLEVYDLSEQEARIASEVAGTALELHQLTVEDVDVDITVVDDEEMRELNRDTRDIDKPTDVLSFPNIDIEFPYEKERYQASDFNPETGALMLGEIIIARGVMQANAAEYGLTTMREFAFLVAHGMLHLLGYDHIEESDRAEMRAMEEKILNAVGLPRE